MITVSIAINGKDIYTRTAVNVTKKGHRLYLEKIECNKDKDIYKVDTGDVLKHNPKDGVVVLAKMMLDTIKEVG